MENNHYNILTDKLPETVIVSGVEYPINFGFRTGILVEEVMRSKKEDTEKIATMLELYYPKIPHDIEGAIRVAVAFFAGAQKKKEKKENPKNAKKPRKKQKQVYSYSKDAIYIYAAFRQQYGINLQRIKDDEMHWWEFLGLFEALDDNTLIRKIMYYRDVNLSEFKGKERKRILELKQAYRLEDDIPFDAKTALAKRNAEMKAYVRERMMSVKQHP